MVQGAECVGKELVEDTWTQWARGLHVSMPQFTRATWLVVQAQELGCASTEEHPGTRHTGTDRKI